MARMMGDNAETLLKHYNRYIALENQQPGSNFLVKFVVNCEFRSVLLQRKGHICL